MFAPNLSPDLAVFAAPSFDANEYASAILAGETYSTSSSLAKSTQDLPAKEDISVIISKLTFSIEDVSKQIKNVVSNHHEAFLFQATTANGLSGALTFVRGGFNDFDSSLEKLRLKISLPYESLRQNVSRLQKLQQVSNILRRTSRFVILARRLHLQLFAIESSSILDSEFSKTHATSPPLQNQHPDNEKERTIAKAALSIAELALLDGPGSERHIALGKSRQKLVDTISTMQSYGTTDQNEGGILRSISAVAVHVQFIEGARSLVSNAIETMIMKGLASLNQTLLASSLQIAYNLRVLPELVENLVYDLSQSVDERIRNAFDISKISKEALIKDSVTTLQHSPPMYRSRVRTEPTNVTAPQFVTTLWSNLEAMIEDMASSCVKVYVLEKVLGLKKDTMTGMLFLDEAMKVLEKKPSATFWISLGRSLERHARDSSKNSAFLQQTLSVGYPRLLRLFHEFFAKIAVHTDTTYGSVYQSPETVFVLRSLSAFESSYLSRSSNKLNEIVSQAFASGIRMPPGPTEGANIARVVANELDSAKFDPFLVRAVASNASSSFDLMLSRADVIVARDRSAVTLLGPTGTPQQTLNASLASCLYHCWLGLDRLKDEYTHSVTHALEPSVQNVFQAYEALTEPIATAIRRELSTIIAKLHRSDFGKNVDPSPGPSLYIRDLTEKLSFIKMEILIKFNIGEAGKTWVMSIVKYVIRTFVLHISIARPLGEGGKLRLASDMAELEFALSAFLVENSQGKWSGNLESIGNEYRVLRAMRPLLFLDNSMLADTGRTAGLPPLIVMHHILVRSPMPLPHNIHGWQEAEYVRWVDEHSEKEAWSLIKGGLEHWEKVSESEGSDSSEAREYIELARAVLRNVQE